jgi:hypothetical protein
VVKEAAHTRAGGVDPAVQGGKRTPPAHALHALQRSIGNKRVGLLLQRASQASTITGLGSPKERAEALAKCSVDDLLDTVFDPAFTKTAGAADLTAAIGALPEADRRRTSLAVRSATGPYDEPFYYEFGLLDGPTRDAMWNRLQKQKPTIANPTARSAAMFAALSGFIRAKTFDAAFRMLNGYSMDDMLALLAVAQAGNLVADLEANWAAAVGVAVERLKTAVKTVKLLDLYRALDIHRAPFNPADVTGDQAAVDKYEKDLDKQLADPEPYPGYKAKITASKAFISSVRADLADFATISATLSAPDKAAVNAFFVDAGLAGFAGGLGDPQGMQGQFVLSSALGDEVAKVLNAQYKALVGLTPAEQTELTQADEALTSALGAAYVGNPAGSYGRVDKAAVALAAKVRKLAGAHGVVVDPTFTACLRRGIKPPPAKQSYGAVVAEVFQPLWNQWLNTKSFPDMSGFRNVYQLLYLKMADQWACQPMTMNMAKLYHLQNSGKPKDPKAALPFTLLYTGAGSTQTKDARGRVLDERVTYRKDLPTIVEKIRTAVDGGWLVHVRVLSGVAMDYTAKREAGEHSLLVVGHSGNTFTCADTDPGGEGAIHLMGGVTALFFDPGANTFASAVGTAMEVNDAGHQVNSRHRYQAWTVQSV